MNTAQALDTFRPRSSESPWAGGALAALAHLLLIAALTLGVSWRIHQPEGGEAELWSAVPQAAAPAPAEAPPPPPPPPVQAQPQPQPVEPEPQAQIAEEKPKPPPKPVKKKPEPPKPVPKPAVKPAPAAAKPAAPAQTLKSGRDDLLARLNRELGSNGAAQANSGRQVGASSGLSSAYKGRLMARIRPNIVLPGMINGNPEAVVTVVTDATGRIVSQRLTQSSGVALWDAAVQRAIERTEVLPLDENGRIPNPLELSFKPRDF